MTAATPYVNACPFLKTDLNIRLQTLLASRLLLDSTTNGRWLLNPMEFLATLRKHTFEKTATRPMEAALLLKESENDAGRLALVEERINKMECRARWIAYLTMIIVPSLVAMTIWVGVLSFKGLMQPNEHLSAVVVHSVVVRSSPRAPEDDHNSNDCYQIMDTYSYRLSGQERIYYCNVTMREKFFNHSTAVNVSLAEIGTTAMLWVVPQHPTNCHGISAHQREEELLEASSSLRRCFGITLIIFALLLRMYAIECAQIYQLVRQNRTENQDDVDNEDVERGLMA